VGVKSLSARVSGGRDVYIRFGLDHERDLGAP
jgi:hypothetical protein